MAATWKTEPKDRIGFDAILAKFVDALSPEERSNLFGVEPEQNSSRRSSLTLEMETSLCSKELSKEPTTAVTTLDEDNYLVPNQILVESC